MRRAVALGGLLALFILPACGGESIRTTDIEARVVALERRLAETCACHPRKIEGLPVQQRIRADIRGWLAEGKDDREILWLGFTRYGSELLAAGIEDLEGRVWLALWIVTFIALLAFMLLVANMRRRDPPPAGPPGIDG
ncbi:MAG: cytochrome c-type biogenesis protein CcmH [Deltaproteobacteria bacterium]|nr:cytochrome c-type biogenesis protein CcmH [Deltaproteobacteria bacterium]